jgi:hypothetical protein
MAYPKTRNQPSWWTSNYSSGWERVKAAFRRDWEQTKADFGSKNAVDINQDAGDTLRQARGKEPIPPGTQPNVPDESDLKRHEKSAQKAQERELKTERRANEAHLEGSGRAPNLDEKARLAHEESLRRDRELGINRNLRWEDIEESVRYGYGAAQHYKDEWNQDFEKNLQNEWKGLYSDFEWRDAQPYVRLGWDRGRNESGRNQP